MDDIIDAKIQLTYKFKGILSKIAFSSFEEIAELILIHTWKNGTSAAQITLIKNKHGELLVDLFTYLSAFICMCGKV